MYTKVEAEGRIVHIKFIISWQKNKGIPSTGHGDLESCETSRLSHFLDNGLTHGGEVVSLTRHPPFTSRKMFDSHLCYRLRWPQDYSTPGKFKSIEKSSDLILNWARNLPAGSIILLPTACTCPVFQPRHYEMLVIFCDLLCRQQFRRVKLRTVARLCV
jgi:hypothetical protein